LLEQEKSLKNEGIWLCEEDPDKYSELLKYKVRLEDQKYWKNRKDYYYIMNNLIKDQVTPEDFTSEFLDLWINDRDKPTINCDPDRESKGFGECITKYFMIVKFLTPKLKKMKNMVKNG
jgi:hypothetical protein